MTQKLILASLLSIVVQAALFVLPQPAAFGIAPPNAPRTTLCVNPGGTGGCKSSIQDAIDAAIYGDLVLVDTGIYTEHITMTNGVSIYGNGWEYTVINGNYSAAQPTVYVPSGITASTVLSGVQVTGGGTGVPGVAGSGIQMWWASPTIVNTWVFSNTGYYGGGVFVRGGSPTFNNVPAWQNRAYRGGGFSLDSGGPITITGNPFEGYNGTVWFNSATDDGGGIFTVGVTLTVSGLRIYGNSSTSTNGGGVCVGATTPNAITLALNHIVGNSAHSGGGIYAYGAGNLTVIGNVLDSNTATYGGGANLNQSAGLFQTNWLLGNTAVVYGGGVANGSGSSGLKIAGNWFERNQAANGAGAAFWGDASPAVDANVFVTNTAQFGGGIYFAQSGVLTATNNIMARNVVTNGYGIAAGVQVSEAPVRLINNTIAVNTGDGIYFDRAEGIVIVNNIISGNSHESIEMNSMNPTTSYTIDYNDRYSNGGSSSNELPMGAHDVSVNPLFKAAGADLAQYYHIQATSPISRTGSLSWAPPKDFDGESRLLCGVSMGADQIPCPLWYLDLPLIRK